MHVTAQQHLRERAARIMSVEPRPFIRWAGSKRGLLSHVIPLLPATFGTYWEPFLGSGALFYLLQPRKAILSDVCEPLVATFNAVRDDAEAVLRYLTGVAVNRETYYTIRSAKPANRFQRAAFFIYLNKTCWNGLYRVNSRGEFNVPYGRPKTGNVIDASNLRECSLALQLPGVTIECSDFEETMCGVEVGDLVFLDPPYVTRHNNNGFIDYNERLFSWFDQERLAATAKRLAKVGATVIVTNADHDDVAGLYEGFQKRHIERSSTLASDHSKRGRVTEAIFYHPGVRDGDHANS